MRATRQLVGYYSMYANMVTHLVLADHPLLINNVLVEVFTHRQVHSSGKHLTTATMKMKKLTDWRQINKVTSKEAVRNSWNILNTNSGSQISLKSDRFISSK